MPRRSSPRLKDKTPKYRSDCLGISPQTKQANSVTKPEPKESMETEKRKAMHRVGICLREPWDHSKLRKALDEARALFPLPSDLELHRPLSELTDEERRDYLRTLEQKRDETISNTHLKDSLRTMVQRYKNKMPATSYQS